MSSMSPQPLPRGAWIELDLSRLDQNFRIIRRSLAPSVRLLAVVKADGYGHGAVEVARCALQNDVHALGVATLGEAAELRQAFPAARIVMLNNPAPDELAPARDMGVALCPGQLETLSLMDERARAGHFHFDAHLKVNTGMNRYGLRWDEADQWAPAIRELRGVRVLGTYSHFAMSDESDKTFAKLQQRRFLEVLEVMKRHGLDPGLKHLCNSGGVLDLPEAHLDMARVGLLPLGVYPSKVCRRLPGILPVMQVKARLATMQTIQDGETVGYGMRYTAAGVRRIGIVPLGYGDGFPRVRNEGFVLVRGRRAAIVGSVAMDAFAVDVTEVPGAELYDEVVLLGRQGSEEITAEELAALKKSVTYDLLAGWRGRLPRRATRRTENVPEAVETPRPVPA